MILADWEIEIRASLGMIEPFEPRKVREGGGGEKILSYGLSSYGYDVRVADEWMLPMVPATGEEEIIDPKKFEGRGWEKKTAPALMIPPNSFALARTVEKLRIPRDCIALCVGKSTYARCGIIVNTTPLEPEWEGQVTLEISNTTPLWAKIYAGEGIAQVLFFQHMGIGCSSSYKSAAGKYMNQEGITLPKV